MSDDKMVTVICIIICKNKLYPTLKWPNSEYSLLLHLLTTVAYLRLVDQG
jgi:hypothetical protein